MLLSGLGTYNYNHIHKLLSPFAMIYFINRNGNGDRYGVLFVYSTSFLFEFATSSSFIWPWGVQDSTYNANFQKGEIYSIKVLIKNSENLYELSVNGNVEVSINDKPFTNSVAAQAVNIMTDVVANHPASNHVITNAVIRGCGELIGTTNTDYTGFTICSPGICPTICLLFEYNLILRGVTMPKNATHRHP